jgi:hypothetical protein
MMRSLVWACSFAAVLSGPAWAADKPEDATQAAAESRLQLVDRGQYEASWDQAAKLF